VTVTDYPDFQTPQEHARAISVTGAPLLNLKSILAQQVAFASIGVGQNITLPNLSIGQVSYEIGITVRTAAGTATPVGVQLQWIDSATGLTVSFQNFGFYAGAVAAPHEIEGHGPSGADLLTVTIVNASALNSLSVQYVILQSSRPYLKHLWRTVAAAPNLPVIPGFTFAACDPASGVLLGASDALPANGAITYLLPLYTGDIFISARTTDGTAQNGQWRITDDTLSGVLGSSIILLVTSGNAGFAPRGAGSYQSLFTLPRGQCSTQAQNLNGAAGQTLTENYLAVQE
jgi:hypothetical protein